MDRHASVKAEAICEQAPSTFPAFDSIRRSVRSSAATLETLHRILETLHRIELEKSPSARAG
jgi:hypothetical protein